MVKLSKQKIVIIDKVAKSFALLNASDKTTVITRDMANAAISTLKELSDELIRLFPKYNTKRIRNGIKNPKHAITVLREIVRLKNRKVLSIKKYKWNKELKKKYCVFTYKLL